MPGNLFELGILNQKVDFYHLSINKYYFETAMKDLGAEIYVVTNYKDANYEFKNNKWKMTILLYMVNKCIW